MMQLLIAVRSVASAGLAQCLRGLIKVYQLVFSPWLGPNCRYDPTCSCYALIALERYGPLQGSWIAVKRIARCHPFGGSGYDPVPDPKDKGKPK